MIAVKKSGGRFGLSIQYDQSNIRLAQSLRKNATPQEKHLWYDFLRTYPVRFQRQKAIGNHIADFYCHKARLVIEVDGSQHHMPQGEADDRARTEALRALGVAVIRYANEDITKRFDGVCAEIDRIVQARVYLFAEE